MDNLTKKINLIDILGMMLPGGLTLILFENDIGFLNALSKSMGEQYDVVLWGVAFLLGSYFVGMVLHELGSMAEKLLWMNPLTDPRVYVALTTGQHTDQLTKNDGKLSWYDVFALICSVLVVSVLLYLASGSVGIVGFLTVVVIFAAAVVLVHRSHYLGLIEVMREDLFMSGRRKVFHEEAKCFHALETTGENARKMEVFNGFRTLARSVLVMFAAAQVYVFLSQGNQGSYLVGLAGHIQSTPELMFLRQLMVVVLAARYWRFSCLRYLYRYNTVQKQRETSPKQGVEA